MSAQTYDPVSVEIHRKALENITNEMAIALTRTSGSPVVYEVQDFATCLLDADAEQLAMSATILFHAGSSLLGTRAVIGSLGEEEAVRPGDGWIVNDPYAGGAMHQGDVAIIMPTFYAGEHIGWAFSNVHVIDIGGMGISGFAPAATSVFDEGLRFTATRIIRDGVIEAAWEEHLRSNVRVADLVLNDLRGMIAANNVSQSKLTGVVDRFGLERFREYCEINKSLSEEALRRRIEGLPDGVYETAEWVEYDGQGEDTLMEVRGRMEVDGSDLRFSFSGDPQVTAFVNSAEGTALGCMMTVILTVLGYGDMPFNGGLWRPLSLDLGEPGSVINAVPPAPVSAGHSAAGQRVTRGVKDLLNQACSLSEDPVLRGRVAGLCVDGAALAPLTGLGRGGAPTIVFFMDNVTGNGGGAQTIGDGQDCYGITIGPGIGLPSVETNEAAQPALYLWRRLVANSGGAGTHRGGQGIEIAYAVEGTEALDGAIVITCAQFPARGAGGGLPAGTQNWSGTHATNVDEALAAGEMVLPDDLRGETPDTPSSLGRLSLARGDVIRVWGGGGGGVGDPLLRDPELVAADVRDGYVSEANARLAYGVALDGSAVDAEATAKLRAEARSARLGATPAREARPPEVAGVAIGVGAEGEWRCESCAGSLGPADGDWHEAAVSRETPVGERFEALEMYVREHVGDGGFVVAEHFCPECATSLRVDVHPAGFEPPATARLRRAAVAEGAR